MQLKYCVNIAWVVFINTPLQTGNGNYLLDTRDDWKHCRFVRSPVAEHFRISGVFINTTHAMLTQDFNIYTCFLCYYELLNSFR